MIAHVEHHEVLLADTDFEVLRDLLLIQGAIMDRHQTDGAGPAVLVVDLAGDGERVGLVPVVQQPTGRRVQVIGEYPIDIDAAAIGRIVGQHHVLQRRLQIFVGIRGAQHRVAVGIAAAAAIVEIVAVDRLTQREVTCRGTG